MKFEMAVTGLSFLKTPLKFSKLMHLVKLFKCYSNHFLIYLSISDFEILAKRVSVLYAVVHGLSKDYEAPSLSRFGNTLPFLFRCKKCRHLRTRTVCVLLLFLAVTRDDLAFRIRVRVQHRRSPHSSNRKTSLSLLAARLTCVSASQREEDEFCF